MFRRRWGQTVPCWIRPLGLLKRTSPPSLLCKLRSGRTLPFHSCRTRLPPPLCQTEAHRPPWSCPRSRPRSYPVGTASGASAVSPTARACDTQSFTTVSYTHLRAHETDSYLVCRLLLEKKKKNNKTKN